MAAHGSFATGGIIDAVKQNESDWLVEKNNYEALTKQVIEALQQSQNVEKCQAFAKDFGWNKFGEKIKAQL